MFATCQTVRDWALGCSGCGQSPVCVQTYVNERRVLAFCLCDLSGEENVLKHESSRSKLSVE